MKTKVHKDGKDTFNKAILAKAEKFVNDYRIIIEKNDNLGYIGSSVELPNVYADGKNPNECYNAVKEALTATVATLIECKRKPPELAKRRTEQVNMRLTAYEKLLLNSKAEGLGYKGIADFIRNVVIRELLKES